MRLLVFTLFCLPRALAQPPAVEPDVGELILQLENRSCAYSTNAFEACKPRSLADRVSDALVGWLTGSRMQYECPLGAARCLEKLGPKASPAVPALLKALREGPDDFDTGDGVIAVRSGIAAALVEIGDHRAVPALAAALEKHPGRSERALLEGLGSFGTAAAEHWKLAEERLRARNRDREFGPKMQEQLEWSMASQIAADEMRRRDPAKTSFAVSNEAVNAARRGIDRTSAAYIKSFEERSGDHLAEAAALALGEMRRSEGVRVLVETLANRHSAWAAARALGQIGDQSPEVVAGLEQGLRSASLGPRAKAECARALGLLGSDRSIPLLRELLGRPDLAEAGAAALGSMGPKASAAMPDLRRLAAQASLAVRQGTSLTYSREASYRGAAKRAAVRAMLAIDASGALKFMAQFRDDPDTGGVIRSAMRRLPR